MSVDRRECDACGYRERPGGREFVEYTNDLFCEECDKEWKENREYGPDWEPQMYESSDEE